jgi:hypothetical protein
MTFEQESMSSQISLFTFTCTPMLVEYQVGFHGNHLDLANTWPRGNTILRDVIKHTIYCDVTKYTFYRRHDHMVKTQKRLLKNNAAIFYTKREIKPKAICVNCCCVLDTLMIKSKCDHFAVC